MTKIRKRPNTVAITLDNLPLEVELIQNTGSAIIWVKELGDSYNIYNDEMSEKDYKNYLKEVSALFTDLDEILHDILQKYRLKKVR